MDKGSVKCSSIYAIALKITTVSAASRGDGEGTAVSGGSDEGAPVSKGEDEGAAEEGGSFGELNSRIKKV